jgi:SulP family sulfate permease
LTARFAALSATLAVVAALAGLQRLGAVADLVSKPVMTGVLFGLGLTIVVGQLPKVLGVEDAGGDFFERAWRLLGDLGDVHGATVAVGAASVAVLLLARDSCRASPRRC